MSGYRGNGYGQYGNVGDDDTRFGDDRGRREERGQEQHRGAAHGNLMGRAEHEARAFFSGDDEGRDPRARQAADDWNRRYGREGHEGSYAQDPSYRSYRERHLAELDRDYDDWCREREQQFHQDFDSWRSNRRQPQAVSNQPGDEQVIGGDREADSLVSDQSNGATPRARRPRS